MCDVAVDLLREGTSVGFDPILHLVVAAPLPEVAGKSNGEFLERVLHVVDLTGTRYRYREPRARVSYRRRYFGSAA